MNMRASSNYVLEFANTDDDDDSDYHDGHDHDQTSLKMILVTISSDYNAMFFS